jgi:hypothetical protein
VGAAITAALSQTKFTQSLDFILIEQRKTSDGLADLAARQDQLVGRVEEVRISDVVVQLEIETLDRRLCTICTIITYERNIA